MMDPTAFSVTLQSNRQTEIFPDNTNYKFRNTAPPGINLRNYKVSLRSAYFTDTYQRTNYEPRILQPDLPTNFFNTFVAANRITIQTGNVTTLSPIKLTPHFDQFIIKTNELLHEHKIPLHISAILDAGKVIGTVLTNVSLDHEHISLDKKLATVLGFRNEIVPRGETKSDLEFDIGQFEIYEINATIGYAQKYTFIQRELELPQIVGRPKLSILLLHIGTLCLSHGHDFSITQKHGYDDILEYDVRPTDKKIILSDYLNIYLGLPRSFAFQGSGSIRVRPGLEDFDEVEIFDPTQASSSKIFICTDLIESNYFGGNQLKYLAIVNRKNCNTEEIEYFPDRSLYKEVVLERPAQIEISFQSDNNEFLPISQTPSIVTLNFKKVGML